MSVNVIAICKLTVVLLAAGSAATCSGESPVVPSPPSVAGDLSAQGGASASGTYVISFLSDGGGPLVNDMLNVGQSLALKATVTDAAGQLATQGAVAFEYCSLKGEPAPKARCESGPGAWKHHMTMRMDESGFPPQVHWGACSTPRSIGFRFRYMARGSAIAAGTSASKDATWVQAL
jgi:hypothetical protein